MTSYKFEVKWQDKNIVRFHLKNCADYLSFEEVYNLWVDSSEFVKLYVNKS